MASFLAPWASWAGYPCRVIVVHLVWFQLDHFSLTHYWYHQLAPLLIRYKAHMHTTHALTNEIPHYLLAEF